MKVKSFCPITANSNSPCNLPEDYMSCVCLPAPLCPAAPQADSPGYHQYFYLHLPCTLWPRNVERKPTLEVLTVPMPWTHSLTTFLYDP